MTYNFVFTILSTIHPINYHYHLYKYLMFNSIGVDLFFSCLKKQRPSVKRALRLYLAFD